MSPTMRVMVVAAWALVALCPALASAQAKAAPKPKSPTFAQLAAMEGIALPVRPLRQICENAFPSSIVQNTPIKLQVQYCGYVSVTPEGNVALAYRQLRAPDGSLAPIWPAQALRKRVDSYADSFRTRLADAPITPANCHDDKLVADKTVLNLCAPITALAGDYKQALALYLKGAETSSDLAIVSLALILLDDQDDRDWPTRRDLFRSTMRKGGQMGAVLISFDDLLDN